MLLCDALRPPRRVEAAGAPAAAAHPIVHANVLLISVASTLTIPTSALTLESRNMHEFRTNAFTIAVFSALGFVTGATVALRARNHRLFDRRLSALLASEQCAYASVVGAHAILWSRPVWIPMWICVWVSSAVMMVAFVAGILNRTDVQ